MNGRDLTLGALAGLVVAGVVAKRRRGSRELTSLSAPQGLSPAQPWKGLVGAAKGGPTMEGWKASLARLPFDLSIEVVGTLKASEVWLAGVRRPGPGKVKMCIYAREHGGNRKQAPSDAFALFSPFTVAHRLFDMSYSTLTKDPKHALALSQALGEVVRGEHGLPLTVGSGEADVDVLREWAHDDCEDAGADLDPEEDEDAWNEAMDGCAEVTFTRWAGIRQTYLDAADGDGDAGLFQSDPLYIYEDAPLPADVAALLERLEEYSHLISRVLVSLFCPTAAGRLLRLTDYSQAMADCYATHIVSGRNPLVRLTVRDLTHFSVDAQVKRWLATASAKKATEGQIGKYRRELERVAVPVLRFLREPDANDDDRSGLLWDAVRRAEELHAQRAGLIEAANGVFAIQRVVVL